MKKIAIVIETETEEIVTEIEVIVIGAIETVTEAIGIVVGKEGEKKIVPLDIKLLGGMYFFCTNHRRNSMRIIVELNLTIPIKFTELFSKNEH